MKNSTRKLAASEFFMKVPLGTIELFTTVQMIVWFSTNHERKLDMNCVQDYCPFAGATSRFFCRKRSWSTCAGVRLLRCAVTISPAVEKALSCNTSARDTQVAFSLSSQERQSCLMGPPPAEGVLWQRQWRGFKILLQLLFSSGAGRSTDNTDLSKCLA